MCIRWTNVPVHEQTLIAHRFGMTHMYEKSNPFY